MIFENRFIYFPVRYPEGDFDRAAAPDRSIQPYPLIEDVYYQTEDGVRIHGWYCTPHRLIDGRDEPLATNAVLLLLHGNAGNIAHRYDQLHLMMFLSIAVFIIDYRGYGRSEGKPSEDGLYLDARGAWDWLTNTRRIAPDTIVLMGQSLGGAVAIDLAADETINPAGLIAESTYTSIADMVRRVMPIMPRFLVRTKMDSLSKISNIDCPKLFIHSPIDEIVPFELGQRLYAAAPEPKQFYQVDGAGHNDTVVVGGKPYLRKLQEFIAQCVAPAASTRYHQNRSQGSSVTEK